MNAIKTERLTIRHIVEDNWKSIKEIWVDFNTSALSQYDKPHITDDEDVRARIAKWAAANSGTEYMFFTIYPGDTVIGYSAFNIRENGHEIGYCFHSAYHGKGYAKESHLALYQKIVLFKLRFIELIQALMRYITSCTIVSTVIKAKLHFVAWLLSLSRLWFYHIRCFINPCRLQ